MTDRQPREQRAQLGSELRQVRMLAGLSGREMARQTGISQPTVVRIERGDSLPSLPEVEAWARAAKVPGGRKTVLVALLNAAVNEVVTFREKLAGGLAAIQREVGEREAVSGTVRNFQPGIIPGLLQTAEYARRVMDMSDIAHDADPAAAVAERLDRQRGLYDKTRRFEFLMTEAALRWRPGPPELLAAQLDHVASLATLEAVELGVIPADAEMHAITRCGFILYEDRGGAEPPIVVVETPHAELTVSDPAQVDLYRDQLAAFRESAVYGAAAIEVVHRIAHPFTSNP